MPHEINVASPTEELTIANAEQGVARISIPLPRSHVADILAVDFLHSGIDIVNCMMAMSHDRDHVVNVGLAVFLVEPTYWAFYTPMTPARWTPAAGRFSVAGDQLLAVINSSTDTLRFSARVYYTVRQVDPRVWALVGRRTLFETP